MKLTRNLIMMTLAFAIFMVTPSFARPGMKHGGMGMGPAWWQNEKVSENLNLSQEQKEQLTVNYQQAHPQMIDHKAGVEKALFAFEQAMGANFDEGEIKKYLRVFLEAKNEMMAARMENLIATRKILTLEQFQKLRSLQQHRGRGGKGPGSKKQAGQQRGGQGNNMGR